MALPVLGNMLVRFEFRFHIASTANSYFTEQFSNGVTVMSIYLRPLPPGIVESGRQFPPIEASIYQIMKEVSLLYCLPQNKFQVHFVDGTLSLQETIYAHCVCIFIGHFLNRLGSEYTSLASLLDSNNPMHVEVLTKIKRRLRQETFTSEYIFDIINGYPDLVRSLYLQFANVHYVQTRGENDDFLPTLSFLRLQVDRVLTDQEIHDLIRRKVVNDHQAMVMDAFMVFNRHILKTNFYTPTKVALSFRLNPSFLPAMEYPQPLYGMFLVIGTEFRGFHLVRFPSPRCTNTRSNNQIAFQGYCPWWHSYCEEQESGVLRNQCPQHF